MSPYIARLRNVCCAAVFLAVGLVEFVRGGADDPLRARFLAEYPQAASRIERALDRIKMESEVTMYYPDVTVEERRVYWVNRDNVRRDTRRTRSSQPGREEERVGVSTPAMSFSVGKDSDTGNERYRLFQISAESPHGPPRLSARAPFAATSFYELAIADFIKEPGFSITKVREEMREDNKTIAVEWSHPLPNRKRWGEFVFDAESWLLVHSKMNLQGPGMFHDPKLDHMLKEVVLTYGKPIDGIPVIEKIEMFGAGKGQRHLHEVEIVTSVSREEIPQEHFSLAEFGININDIPRGRNPLYWLIAAAIAALVAFLALRSFRRRMASR